MVRHKSSAALVSLSLMLLAGCGNQNSLAQECKRVESPIDRTEFQEGVIVATEADVAAQMGGVVLIEGATESIQAELPLAEDLLSKLQSIEVTDPELNEHYQTYVAALETYVDESQKAVEVYLTMLEAIEARAANSATDSQEQILETASDDLQTIHAALESPSKQMQEARVDISIRCIAAAAQ